MPKNWSIPRTSYDALEKLNIQRSPAIDRAIWACKVDPTKIIKAMEERLTQALAAPAPAPAPAPAAAEAEATKNYQMNKSALKHRPKPVPGSKIVGGDEYVRVSVSYPKKTEEAVEYLAGLFKLSYEETVRLSLEAYIKHL